MGWYCSNSGQTPHPVARKTPNAWGLYDMHANLFEWCQHCYEQDYPIGDVTDPKGPLSGMFRVLRGGGWLTRARYCRSAARHTAYNVQKSQAFRFRVASVEYLIC